MPLGTVVPRGTARPCHLAAPITCVGFRGSAGYGRFGSLGLPCDAFSQLNSPPRHSFLLNVVHLSVSSIKSLKISKDVI